VNTDSPLDEKDKIIAEQAKMIKELELLVKGQEDKDRSTLGSIVAEQEFKRVKDDVERTWTVKVEEERKLREEKEKWAEEVVRALDKEKKVSRNILFHVVSSLTTLLPSLFQVREKLEGERRALAAFVSKFDSLGLGSNTSDPPSKIVKPPMPSPGGAMTAYERRQSRRSFTGLSAYTNGVSRLPRISDVTVKAELESENVSVVLEDFTGGSAVSVSTITLDGNIGGGNPLRLDQERERMHFQALNHPRLLDQTIPEEVENCLLNVSFDEAEVEDQLFEFGDGDVSVYFDGNVGAGKGLFKPAKVESRKVLEEKENLVPSKV